MGLVDHMGGLDKAVKVAAALANLPLDSKAKFSPVYRLETLREPKGGLPFPFASAGAFSAADTMGTDALAVADDSIACSGLVSSESLGINPIFKSLGLNQLFAYNIAHTSFGGACVKAIQAFLGKGPAGNNAQDFLDSFFG